MPLLPIGAEAPDIAAQDAEGKTVHLRDMRGRHVLVYFYPKDDTPGCTTEACALNDSLDELDACGAHVIGVSTDSEESHGRFRRKYGLRFALASDRDRSIADAYGVGRTLGVLPLAARTSFLVGPDGRIAEVWPRVNPSGHSAEVLAAVKRRATPA